MRVLWVLVLIGCGGASDTPDETDVVEPPVDDVCRPAWPVDVEGTTWTFGPAEGWKGGDFVATETAEGEGLDPDGRPGWWVSAVFAFDRPEGERFEVSSRRLYRCGPLGYGVLYEEELTELETPSTLERTLREVRYAAPLLEVGVVVQAAGGWDSATTRTVVENGEVIEDEVEVARSCAGVDEVPSTVEGVPDGVRYQCTGDLDIEVVIADGVGPVRWGEFRQLVAYEPGE